MAKEQNQVLKRMRDERVARDLIESIKDNKMRKMALTYQANKGAEAFLKVVERNVKNRKPHFTPTGHCVKAALSAEERTFVKDYLTAHRKINFPIIKEEVERTIYYFSFDYAKELFKF